MMTMMMTMMMIMMITYVTICTAHSPDNSFMGFVIERHGNFTSTRPHKKNRALVYGKNAFMWRV